MVADRGPPWIRYGGRTITSSRLAFFVPPDSLCRLSGRSGRLAYVGLRAPAQGKSSYFNCFASGRILRMVYAGRVSRGAR